MYYKVRTIYTSRNISNKQEQYSAFDNTNHHFKTLEEVKAYLSEHYGKSKRVKMYCNTKDGKQKHIGYIYGFKNKDWSHNSPAWYQQDWVEITQVEEKRMLI
jgi:hypothetical protein